MRVTVLQQTVGDVADLQQVLVEVFLHGGVNSPAHHLHAPLCPELNVVPDVERGRRKKKIIQWSSVGK